MHKTSQPAALLLLAGLALLTQSQSSCSPGAAAAAAQQAPVQRSLEGTGSDAWIVHVGEQSLFTMWISPNIATAPGDAFRFLTMVGHLPGSAHPFFGQQTQVQVQSNREITGDDQSGLYSLSIRPKDGLLWGDVKTQGDCELKLSGFF